MKIIKNCASDYDILINGYVFNAWRDSYRKKYGWKMWRKDREVSSAHYFPSLKACKDFAPYDLD